MYRRAGRRVKSLWIPQCTIGPLSSFVRALQPMVGRAVARGHHAVSHRVDVEAPAVHECKGEAATEVVAAPLVCGSVSTIDCGVIAMNLLFLSMTFPGRRKPRTRFVQPCAVSRSGEGSSRPGLLAPSLAGSSQAETGRSIVRTRFGRERCRADREIPVLLVRPARHAEAIREALCGTARDRQLKSSLDG